MELTNSQKKIDLVARLVKEGAIDFNEAIELLEVEPAWLFDPNTFRIPDVWPYNPNPYPQTIPAWPYGQYPITISGTTN